MEISKVIHLDKDTRRNMKTNAKHRVFKHYIIVLTACLIAAFMGTEFSDSLNFLKNSNARYVQDSKAAELYTGFVGSKQRLQKIAQNVMMHREDDAKKIVDESKKDQANDNSKVLSRKSGVLASIINNISSGSFIMAVLASISSVVGSSNMAIGIFIVLCLGILFLFWFYFENVYPVIMRRIFLEGRIYDKVPIQRFIYLARVRKWTKASWAVFVKHIFLYLWACTLVGGFIKYFSYFLVPYIVAENPDLSAREAITLSRKMMNGHKWECFVLSLTFIGWNFLNIITMGMVGLFFSNPYKIAFFSEYYAYLRKCAIDSDIEGAEFLNDKYLFEIADKDVLNTAYEDVYEVMEEAEVKIPGIRGVLIRTFGVTFVNNKREREYEASQEKNLKIRTLKDAAEGKAYPRRLSPFVESQTGKIIDTIHYMRHYSVFSLIMLFFIFSIVGWVWEVILHMVMDGMFINRGILHGPWLPIYGTGGVLILVALNRLRKYPVLGFISTIVLCGVIEYFTAYFMDVCHGGKKWWDYTGYFMNIQGRVCAEGLLVFGLGGIFIVYLIAPILDNFIRKIDNHILILVCAVLVAIFMFDFAYSMKKPNIGKGITEYEEVTGIININGESINA